MAKMNQPMVYTSAGRFVAITEIRRIYLLHIVSGPDSPYRCLAITSGHWKANGRILGNFLWKIPYKNLDLKGGGTGRGYAPRPLYRPF